MAEVKKARLFLRRGSDTDRKLTTLCEGELGYSTDAFRVVVGDGITAGGRSLGATVFVSGGSNFHTNLSEASASGIALSGDFAAFPAQSYFKANGTTASNPSASATNVMLLTGADASAPASWVAVNSGIPYGNIDVQDNDISGDYVSGGTITAPITLSGGHINIGGASTESVILSGIALAAQNTDGLGSTVAFTADESVIYPLGITGSAQLTAVSGVESFTNAIPDSVGGTNYYWDHYGSTGGNSTVEAALESAVAAFNSVTKPGDMLYVRFGFVRTYSRGNGGRSNNVTAKVGFLKTVAHLTLSPATDTTDYWVQISSVFHGRGNTQTALRSGSISSVANNRFPPPA